MRAGIIAVVVALLNQLGCTAMHMQRARDGSRGGGEGGRRAGSGY